MESHSDQDIRDKNDAADAAFDNAVFHPHNAAAARRSVGLYEMQHLSESARAKVQALVAGAITNITFAALPGDVIRGEVGIVPTRELVELLAPELLRYLPEVTPVQQQTPLAGQPAAETPERSAHQIAAELRTDGSQPPKPTIVVDGQNGQVIGQIPPTQQLRDAPPLQPVPHAPAGSAVKTPGE